MTYIHTINVNPNTLSLRVGKHYDNIDVEILPTNASCQEVTWESENTDVVAINETSGSIYAVGIGSAKVYAVATDGSSANGYCMVNVSAPILATSINIGDSCITLKEKQTRLLSAEVSPAYTTNKTVKWTSEDSQIATVSQDGSVYAVCAGTTKIYAKTTDGSAESDFCTVTVEEAIGVSSVTLDRTHVIMNPDDEIRLTVTVLPKNASYSGVTWTCSNTNIAKVQNGKIVALKKGTVTVIARAGAEYARCTVEVTDKEKVRVEKDGDYFNVVFGKSGAVWRSIGCDLSLSDNRTYGRTLTKKDYNYLYKEHEKRYVENIDESFSKEQIAFLYLFDPLGIQYFVEHNYLPEIGGYSRLFLKDDIYQRIFGDEDLKRDKFYFKLSEGVPVYGDYTGVDRKKVFSNAEILFGDHVIWNVQTLIIDVVKTVFCAVFPKVSAVSAGIDVVKALFFSGAIVDSFSNAATSFLDNYAKKHPEEIELGQFNNAISAFGILGSVLGAIKDSIITLDETDIQIYNKIKNQDFVVEYTDGNLSLTIVEILKLSGVSNDNIS